MELSILENNEEENLKQAMEDYETYLEREFEWQRIELERCQKIDEPRERGTERREKEKRDSNCVLGENGEEDAPFLYPSKN